MAEIDEDMERILNRHGLPDNKDKLVNKSMK